MCEKVTRGFLCQSGQAEGAGAVLRPVGSVAPLQAPSLEEPARSRRKPEARFCVTYQRDIAGGGDVGQGVFRKASQGPAPRSASVQRILQRGLVSATQAASITGKLYFMLSTAFGCVGLAVLYVLRDGAQSAMPGSPAYYALRFAQVASGLLKARRYHASHIKARRRPPLYIWSDAYYASWEAHEGSWRRGAGIGFVCYDPETKQAWTGYMQTPEYFFALFVLKKQYVGQLESLAVLAADITMSSLVPGCMQDREVLHFIDNDSSLAGLQKGYSSKPDTALILMAFWLHASAVSAIPRFEWVASALNIADLASRDKYAMKSSKLSQIALELK